MVRPKKEQQNRDLREEIKRTARKQMAEIGAATLSLRAIARDLKITAPAIYNYFSNRDDLVTALIVDAYNSLSKYLIASQMTDEESHVERILASARAYRNWALNHPEEYSLIFGTPIPNYHAPMEITGPAAASAMGALIDTLDAAWQAGVLQTNKVFSSPPEMIVEWIKRFDYKGDPAVIHFAMMSWSQIHGIVSLELNGHYSSFPKVISVDSFFEIEIQASIKRMTI